MLTPRSRRGADHGGADAGADAAEAHGVVGPEQREAARGLHLEEEQREVHAVVEACGRAGRRTMVDRAQRRTIGYNRVAF